MPVMIAMNVPSSRIPLPHDSRFSGSNSGKRPYFDGPKKALCTPIPQTAAIPNGTFLNHNPTSANSISNISKTFTPMVMRRLLNRSAR